MKTPNPIIAISMITYNQEKYVAEAINGVLMQKTSFPFKLFIGDDHSTDTTSVICNDFQSRFPEMIDLTINNANLGFTQNGLNTMSRALASGARYIALLEGDDYWTDPGKLHKQVEFLKKNPDYSLSTHRYLVKYEARDRWGRSSWPGKKMCDGIIIDNRTMHLAARTLTMVFRSESLDMAKFSEKYIYDYSAARNVLAHGKGYCLNFVGGVYRRHPGGIWSGKSPCEKIEFTLSVRREEYRIQADPRLKKEIDCLEQELAVEKTLSRCKYPLFHAPIYRAMLIHLWKNKSIKFAWSTLLRMTKYSLVNSASLLSKANSPTGK
jgi:glycosyltransferase involved in cell wall biosynthesis